jgi:hypothetical protein
MGLTTAFLLQQSKSLGHYYLYNYSLYFKLTVTVGEKF